jgi:NADH:ubiquinone oxidoreductase subunit K
VRAERSNAGNAAGRGYPSPRSATGAPRGRAGERSERELLERERHARSGRPPEGRTPDPRERRDPREAGRTGPRHSGEFRRPTPPVDGRRTGSSTDGRTRSAPTSGPRLGGALAVLGIFLLTLAAAAADSYIGLGLGTITLVALTAGSVAATLLVRRRDLLSVLVAPPLVFVAVAIANIGLAPSATLNLPTLATLLVRGFPAMGIATAAAIVVSLYRLIRRR